MEIELLAFGAHPDDVEAGCGGTIAKIASEGKNSVIIDITRSQLSTYGDIETRLQESQCAAKKLGAIKRENLGFQDGMITDTYELRIAIADKIREYRPQIVVAPYGIDRHPDHAALGNVVKNAVFFAGLSKIETAHSPRRPRLLLYYPIRTDFVPSLIVRLTKEQYDKKLDALGCFISQGKVNTQHVFEYFQSRHKKLGFEVGSEYGEGFLMEGMLGVDGFDEIKTKKL